MDYTIENLLIECKNKNYLELLDYLSKESSRVDLAISTLRNHHNLSEYQLREYQNYNKGFLFFLNTGSIPATIEKEDFKIFLPIINRLVEEGSQSKNALQMFE